jgi:nicotinamidase/pyrazinamidase
MSSALVLVDIQNDFLPGGALGVPDGDAVIPVANRLAPLFELVVATQDWHPPDHSSFALNHRGRRPGEIIQLRGMPQVLWPAHCVQHTAGAAFASGLDSRCCQRVVQKGTDADIDSYSGFFDNGHEKATGLEAKLREQRIENLYVLGLATDYCVKFTALDARQLGFEVWLVEDGCRGVDLKPGDSAAAVAELANAGVHVVQSRDLTRIWR